MADQEQLAAFAYHWRAAGLAETTLRYYLSWLGASTSTTQRPTTGWRHSWPT